MNALAIQELKKDFEAHSARASKGDARSAYAAHEVLSRLETLGADQQWIEQAKASAPMVPMGPIAERERSKIAHHDKEAA